MSEQTKDYLNMSPKEYIKQTKDYLNMSPKEYLLILGIAISGIAALINTYNAASNIIATECQATTGYQTAIQNKLIVILVISCLVIVVGIILSITLKEKRKYRGIFLSLISMGLFGILYALTIKFQNAANVIKVGISWGALIGLVALKLLSPGED
jgi:ABC-type sugar transport system permease subunit